MRLVKVKKKQEEKIINDKLKIVTTLMIVSEIIVENNIQQSIEIYPILSVSEVWDLKGE